MRKLLTLASLLLVGCVGTQTGNPMGGEATSDPWWQANTYGVAQEDNPWEAFNQPVEQTDEFDPWSTYDHPGLFPEDWEPTLPEQEESGSLPEDTEEV